MDENAIYVILGSEIQDRVHYEMPVKDGLYDMIGYSRQIEEIRRSYRKETGKANDVGELIAEDGYIRIKLTSEENYTMGSMEIVWWKCEYGHSWLARIANRCRYEGCPTCKNTK